MKIISSKVHGVLDYLVGALFVALPFLANWDTSTLQSRVLFTLGVMTLFYSAITKYELGLFKMVPFRLHLLIDLISGMFLIVTPWLLGFAHEVYLPHVLLGLIEVLVVLMTDDSGEMDRINSK